ncbi:MAG TPA: flagellar biosynthetic protein FliO [Desulfuromonadaceae bacterium]
MKRAAAALVLLCLPSPACAEGTASPDYSFLSSFLQMIAALAIVVGLILLTRHFSGKFIGTPPASRLTSKHIRVVETRYLAPKKALVLVEVGGAYLLLASSEDNLTLVKQVNILEDIEILDSPGRVRGGLAGLLRKGTDRQKG